MIKQCKTLTIPTIKYTSHLHAHTVLCVTLFVKLQNNSLRHNVSKHGHKISQTSTKYHRISQNVAKYSKKENKFENTRYYNILMQIRQKTNSWIVQELLLLHCI